jgi:hypothetical protein
MAEWRDILERAADNLSIDQAPFRQQPAGWPAHARVAGAATFSNSRDLLARELSAAPARTQTPARGYRAPITRAIVEPVLTPQPQISEKKPRRKSASGHDRGREIAALSISVGVVAMTVYGIFALLH